MAITYKGTDDFTLQSDEPTRPYLELPSKVMIYRGSANKLAAFVASTREGTAWSGGYIVEQRVREQGMYPEVQLWVALPPNFSAYTVRTQRSNQTASKGATVTTSSVIPGATEVEASRTISYVGYDTIFTYWASQRPDGPRFTNPTIRETPRLRRSIVTATANGSSRTFYGGIPAPLSAALAMNPVGIISNHTSDPIAGTPWYRCEDTITWGYTGD